MKSVLKDLWCKTQQKVRWIGEYLDMVDEYTSMDDEEATLEHMDCPTGKIPFKQLERTVGFLVYVSQTYTCMVPYLKGIYLTLNSWCHGREETGWKIPKQQRDDAELHDGLPPQFVKRVARLQSDVATLTELTLRENPPEVLVCVRHLDALYLVGDAS